MSTSLSSPGKLSAWLLIILILIATWIRLWQFPNIPPAFNYDEAYNVIDALWLRESGSFVAFLPGNTGRHALFHYLAIPFLTILGPKIFAFRFLSVVIGIAVIPLMYRWVVTMFADEPMRRYLGLVSSAGLAFSFWHVAISRSGFRASLLLLLYILMAYLFWRGWQHRSAWAIAGAGIMLGLSQYTYWLAALLPLQFGLFALILTFWSLGKLSLIKDYQTYNIRKIWLWIGIMAITSFVIFIPLGLLYLDIPLVLQYISQSSIVDKIANDRQTTWSGHLLDSIRIFLDGPVALWQGQISRSLSFDWLTLIGFWLGLIVAFKRRHQPAYLFLLTGLFVLWLPAPLNDIDFSDLRLPDMLPVHHAISNLRIAGVLPIYYTLVAIGLLTTVRWISQRMAWPNKPAAIGVTTFILMVVFSGGLNTYDFFERWPKQPFLYERYNGPILDLAQNLVRESQNNDILMPFHLYAHPTMHLFFDEIFTESDTPPADSHGSAILVTTSNASLSSYMWLVRSGTGPGAAYITPPLETSELLQLSDQPMQTYNLAAPLMFNAQTSLIPNLEPVRPQLAEWAVPNPVNYTWSDQVRLVGYQVTPNWTQPGQPINLTLYWQNLTDQPLTHDVFIHAINSQGEGVGQVDGIMLEDGHRWRKDKLTPTDHTIQLSDQLKSGPYLIRLGLFNTRTGARIAIIGAEGETLGDQVLLGLFYITDKDQIPTLPLRPIQATLGEQIQLLGYSLPGEQTLEGDQTFLSPEIHWRATEPVGKNYTIFLQLLDSQNQFVTGYDTQPLHGNYPTSLWQTGETVIERVDLPLPAQLKPGDYRLATGMYEASTGQRLVARNEEGQPYNDNMIILSNVQVLSDKITLVAP